VHTSIKVGTSLKSGHFTQISSSSMKTVAHIAYKHRHAAYHNKHW